jgi:hypothetical protein
VSVQALAWVLEDAPDLPPHLVGTLMALANHADRSGRGAHPGQAAIAWYTRKSDRAVRKDLIQLSKLGLIREGDQRLVSHIPADARPVVYDLATNLTRGPRERNHSSGPTDTGSGTTVPVEQTEGAEPQFRASNPRDRNYRVRGTGTTVPTNQRLNQLPLPQAASTPTARIADALQIEEEEAVEILNRIKTERRPVAPSRYVDALIASGDIAQFRTVIRTAPAYAGPRCQYAASDGRGQSYCTNCHKPAAHPSHGSPT